MKGEVKLRRERKEKLKKEKRRRKRDKKENDEISMLMKSNDLIFPKETMKRVVSEIGHEIGHIGKDDDSGDEEPENEDENGEETEKEKEKGSEDRQIWFKKEAYQVLHHAAESYLLDVFKGASNVCALRSKKMIEPDDLKTVLQSLDDKGMVLNTMFSEDEIKKQTKERRERKEKRKRKRDRQDQESEKTEESEKTDLLT